MRQNPIVFISFGILLLAYLEARLASKQGIHVYSKPQTEIAIGLAIGHLLVSLTLFPLLQKLILVPPEHQLFILPNSLAWGILAFLVLDFLAYLNHRFSHTVPLFWADHAVHHANTEFNVVTHLAHGWTGFVSASLIFSLLTNFVGNTGTILFVYFAVATLIQTIAHTQLIHQLGFLEKLFVTPSNHRVHHAIDRKDHDNNYGIVFIFWDKLLGTFKAEGETQVTKFGLAQTPALHSSVWKHAFFAWSQFLNARKS